MACYRAQQIAHATFSAVKGRTKDYVAKPKKNGYQSLHSALIVSDDTDDTDDIEDDDPSAKNKNDSPSSSSSSSSNDNNHDNNSHNNGSRTTIELQIRTRRMHASAEIGNAAHSSYKGGFTEGDPGAAKTLKDLVDAANIAAYEKFGDFTDNSLRYEGVTTPIIRTPRTRSFARLTSTRAEAISGGRVETNDRNDLVERRRFRRRKRRIRRRRRECDDKIDDRDSGDFDENARRRRRRQDFTGGV